MNIALIKPNGGAIDVPHGMLILGALLSAKPKNVLEIGIGTGFITNLLLDGISYNQIGELTSIDNFHDLGGNLPNSTLENLKTKPNIKIIAPIEEKDFVFSIEENQFDLTVHRYVERKSGVVGVEFADALVGFEQAHKDLNSAMKKMESVIKAGL